VVAALIVAAVGVLVEMVLLRRYIMRRTVSVLATFGLTLMSRTGGAVWGQRPVGPPCSA